MVDVRGPLAEGSDEVAVSLDELAREGARRMITAALEAEVEHQRVLYGLCAPTSTPALLAHNLCQTAP